MRRVIFLHFLLLPCCAAAALAQTTGYIEGRIAGLTGKDGEYR